MLSENLVFRKVLIIIKLNSKLLKELFFHSKIYPRILRQTGYKKSLRINEVHLWLHWRRTRGRKSPVKGIVRQELRSVKNASHQSTALSLFMCRIFIEGHHPLNQLNWFQRLTIKKINFDESN